MSTTEKKIPTYKEYLNSQLDVAKSNAEKARTSAINNAQRQYNQSLTTYGNQATALSNMGLTGSGYSQYLEGQALAQKNAAINNAYRTEADAKTAAENAYNTQYQTYLQQQQQNADTAFNNMLTNIDSYSLGDIKYLSGQYEMNEDQMKYLMDAVLKSGNYTLDDLGKVKEDIGSAAYTKYYEGLINSHKGSNVFEYTEDGTTKQYTATKSKALIDAIANAIGEENVAELRTKYDGIYKPQTVDGLKISGNTFGRNYVGGDDFRITDGTNTYRVQSGGVVDKNSDPDLYAVASSNGLASGDVFRYNNAIYAIGDGGQIFKVVQRALGTNIQKLVDLFNSKKPNATTTGGTT